MLNGAETTFTVSKNGAKRCLTDAYGLLARALSKKRKMGKGTREPSLALGERSERMLARRKGRKGSGTSKPVLILRKKL